MKKITFIGAFALMLVLAFFGCDNGEHTHTWKWTKSTVWGMEKGACNGCTKTRLRLSPDMIVQIPGGENITMTSFMDSSDSYTVNLSAFKICKYQVTQAQYEAITGINTSRFLDAVAEGEVQEKRPVEMVSWFDAVNFCNKLSVLEGLNPVYTITDRYPLDEYPILDATVTADFSKNGYRLPTEAQWDYACRAGSTGNFSKDILGNEVTFSNIGEYAWYADNSSGISHEVGKKIANAFGLYDMHGNVFEWCWDFLDRYPSEPKTDYTGPVEGYPRVLRGGGWWNRATHAAHSFRASYTPTTFRGNFGFRVALP